MTFYADLHVHSRFSRATSRNCDLEHLAIWARKKGIAVVGTGDFTHPAWRAELKDQLVPAEPGLFRLRPDLERVVEDGLPPACRGSHAAVRFMLSVEISTIYKKGEKTRKIHHLVYCPDFESADRLVAALSRIGNLNSDGRPILGLDSRHLLEMTLESGPDSYLVPAHVWTPWFAALGSKSGFDAVDDCYGDLAPHIFAVETGLSSDPPMNWRVSSLDRFRLMSNSDAHSPEKLGREVCVFHTEMDYFALRRALETGHGYGGTLEFFPEEGKYHLDGHRNCNVRLEPDETRRHNGRCPACGKPLTVGVMHRVEDLADRGSDATPPGTAGDTQGLIPLPEILGEIHRVGPKSKRVAQDYEGLLARLGPELPLLNSLPLEEIGPVAPSLVAEAVARLRRREVIREAGYDGVYGTIRLFRDAELERRSRGASLFGDDLKPVAQAAPASADEVDAPPLQEPPLPGTASPPSSARWDDATSAQLSLSVELQSGDQDPLAGLDADQRRAAEIVDGPLLIVAGPGSGKTRTLTHRLAHLVTSRGVAPGGCLAVTFTRRAADEVRGRLRALLPDAWDGIPLHTFHSLGLSILREHWNAAGLQRGFRVASEAERLSLMQDTLEISERQARARLSGISRAKRTGAPAEDQQLAQAWEAYRREMETRNWCDFDDLVIRAADALEFDDECSRQGTAAVSVGLHRRVPGRGRAAGAAHPAARAARRQRLRHRRSRPGHLRLPRRRPAVLRRLHRTLPRRPGDEAQPQLPLQLQHRHPLIAGHRRGGLGGAVHPRARRRPQPRHPPRGHERKGRGGVRRAIAGRDPWGPQLLLHRQRARGRGPGPRPVLFGLRRALPHRSPGHGTGRGAPALRHALPAALPRSPAGTSGGGRAGIDGLGNSPDAGSVRQRLEAARGDDQTAREACELLNPLADACGDDLERFLAEVTLATQVDTWDPRADRISLLTLHAAKGLEFPIVFIVGCEDGLLPLTWGKPEPDGLAEERRLFYVGVTRAMTRLYLCRARKRLWRGRVRELPPSPYLADIEERLLEQSRSRAAGGRIRKQDNQLDLFS